MPPLIPSRPNTSEEPERARDGTEELEDEELVDVEPLG